MLRFQLRDGSRSAIAPRGGLFSVDPSLNSIPLKLGAESCHDVAILAYTRDEDVGSRLITHTLRGKVAQRCRSPAAARATNGSEGRRQVKRLVQVSRFAAGFIFRQSSSPSIRVTGPRV